MKAWACLSCKAPTAGVPCWGWSSWLLLWPCHEHLWWQALVRGVLCLSWLGSLLQTHIHTHRVLHGCCHAWKNSVWQGCFPSNLWSRCTVIHMDGCFPGDVTFLPNRNVLSLDLYFSVISPKLSITGESSIICKVTIKASGLIWGSGPPLQFSLTIVLNPLMLQRNRMFIRWGIGGQGADNHFYCRWDIAVLFLRTARQIGNHGHG